MRLKSRSVSFPGRGDQRIFLRIRLGRDLSHIFSVPIGQLLASNHRLDFLGDGDTQSSWGNIYILLPNICNLNLGTKGSSCLSDSYFFCFTYPQPLLQTPTVSEISRWELITPPPEIYTVNHYEVKKGFGKDDCYQN